MTSLRHLPGHVVIGALVLAPSVPLLGCESHWVLPPQDTGDTGDEPNGPLDDAPIAGAAAGPDAMSSQPPPPDPTFNADGSPAPPLNAGGFAAPPPQPPMGGWPAPMPPPDVTFAHMFTDAERELYRTLSPLPEVPPDTTNRVADDDAAAVLGQRLFFDPRYSGPLKIDSDLGPAGEPGRVACVSCHWGEHLDDQRSVPLNVSVGVDRHTRNALPLINSAFYRWTNWAGRFSAQWELSLAVAESGVIMNSSRLAIAQHIFHNYGAEYEAAFGPLDPLVFLRLPPAGKPKPAPTMDNPMPPDGAWEGMSADDQLMVNTVFVNYGKALQAYMRRLVSRNTPFDAFVAGDGFALSAAEQEGLALFIGKARCVHCHNGPHLSDGLFHNTGVAQTGPNVPAVDEGRFKDIKALLASPFTSASSYSDDPQSGRLAGLTDPPPTETLGAFRTPSLRGVSLTAPYMHSGQLATLEEVIEFYDRGGDAPVVGQRDPLLVPLHLTPLEKVALVQFLHALVGERIPDELLQGDFEPPPADW